MTISNQQHQQQNQTVKQQLGDCFMQFFLKASSETTVMNENPSSGDDLKNVLRQQLQLPASNPRIAHWLFANRNSKFHADTPLLSPDAFRKAIAINIRHSYSPQPQHANQRQQSQFNSFTQFAPTIYDIMNEFDNSNVSPAVDKAAIDLLFAPAAFVDGIMVGYDWALPVYHPNSKQFQPFPNMHIQHGSPMLGRFAFDVREKKLIVVLNNISHIATGIISINWDENGQSRARHFFTVPNEQYSFEYLPNKVIVCLSNLELKLSSDQFPTSPELSESSNSSTDHSIMENIEDPKYNHVDISDSKQFVQKGNSFPDILTSSLDFSSLPNSDPFSSTQPEFSDDLLLVDPIDETVRQITESSSNELPHKQSRSALVTRRPRSKYDDNSVFNMTTLMSCMEELNIRLTGKYYGPNLKQEICNPFTGEVGAPSYGECKASLTTATQTLREQMQQIAAQSYYASAFSLVSEKWLPFPKRRREEKEVTLQEDLQHMMSVPSINMVQRSNQLVPCDKCQSCGNVMVSSHSHQPLVNPIIAQPQPMDEEAIKEAKREAKRRRNRLSAARSNQKRKERMEEQKKELQLLKETEKELQAIHEKLKIQNEGLKKQAATMQV